MPYTKGEWSTGRCRSSLQAEREVWLPWDLGPGGAVWLAMGCISFVALSIVLGARVASSTRKVIISQR